MFVTHIFMCVICCVFCYIKCCRFIGRVYVLSSLLCVYRDLAFHVSPCYFLIKTDSPNCPGLLKNFQTTYNQMLHIYQRFQRESWNDAFDVCCFENVCGISQTNLKGLLLLHDRTSRRVMEIRNRGSIFHESRKYTNQGFSMFVKSIF